MCLTVSAIYYYASYLIAIIYVLFFLYLVLTSIDRKVLLQLKTQYSKLNIDISYNMKTLSIFAFKRTKEKDRFKTDVYNLLSLE